MPPQHARLPWFASVNHSEVVVYLSRRHVRRAEALLEVALHAIERREHWRLVDGRAVHVPAHTQASMAVSRTASGACLRDRARKTSTAHLGVMAVEAGPAPATSGDAAPDSTSVSGV